LNKIGEEGINVVKLGIQTLLLPGSDLAEQFANAARFGFDGVEVAVGPAFDLTENINEVRAASASSGIPVCAICTHPIHDPLVPDVAERVRRFAALADLLRLADELGAYGVVSVPVRPPHVFDLANRDQELFELAVTEFARWAAALPEGNAAVFLEPLNRYEANFLNRVGQAVALADHVAHSRVIALGDLFHMNIEEADLGAPLRAAAHRLGHVHIADNNRFEPGAGCLDFRTPFAALKATAYDGFFSIECWSPKGPKLSGDPEDVLPKSVQFLREQWNAA
jgi:sugar phosphate isomerase/epimerase